jgi:hypothetical protein
VYLIIFSNPFLFILADLEIFLEDGLNLEDENDDEINPDA